MHPRKPSAAFLLVALISCAVLLAGCGGGGGGQGGGQDGGGQGGGQGGQQPAPESKILIGTVRGINTEAERFTMVPRVEEQGKEPQVFKLTPNARVTLGEGQAEFSDMKQGQQAQVEYIVRKDLNRARSVQLFESGEGGGSN